MICRCCIVVTSFRLQAGVSELVWASDLVEFFGVVGDGIKGLARGEDAKKNGDAEHGPEWCVGISARIRM